METVKERKSKVVEQIKDKLKKNELSVFINFKGISVTDFTSFRKKMRQFNADVCVYKNTLLRRSTSELTIDDKSFFVGPTALISITSDMAAVCKALFKFNKDNKKDMVKGAILENQIVPKDVVKEIADLPSKKDLIAKFFNVVNSPINRFGFVLASQLVGLLRILNSVKIKKEEEEKNDK